MAKTEEEIVLFESITGNSYIIHKSNKHKPYVVEIMWLGESCWKPFDHCMYMPSNMIYDSDIIHIDER